MYALFPVRMQRIVTDRYLPPDHAAFVAAEPPTGRLIVIAPTRAACETIEIALGLHIPTLLEKQHGREIRDLAGAGKGFGIVAGTGTGKTLSIRPMAETILGTGTLKVGVVNREREATPETPTWNVIVVTTGIARRWFQDGDILPTDTLVVDEIHQTSAELELCLALGKRVGCRFIWLSATVDPTFYARYLNATAVLETSAFDPARAADVKIVRKEPLSFLDDRFLQQVVKERRGVGMFLPTRAGVEQAAELVRERFPRINSAFYHGGEPIRIIRPFLEGEETKPYFLAMTAAGQSALNVHGLDTVVIDDTRFSNIIERGKNVLTRLHLGANEILQMAGRVHGRVSGGRVFILSDRDIHFSSLQPTAPEFQLAGDSERVAMTCADLGVRADELELPVPLDRIAYRKAVTLLEQRGIIENGRLSRYGKAVEAMPVDRPWAELLVNASDHSYRKFSQRVAQYMPLDLVSDEQTVDGSEARVSKTSVCGSWGAIAGSLRYFADRSGIPRAAIEGTQIPMELIRRYATRGEAQLIYDPRRKHGPLILRQSLEYFGFELDSETETVEEFPAEHAAEARHLLAEAVARGEARHFAVKKNRDVIEEIREAYKRSGGETPRFGLAELTALYENQLADVNSLDDFRAARPVVDREKVVPRALRGRLEGLPNEVMIRDRQVDIDYDVEERDGQQRGGARLRVPEKIARTLTEGEIPRLDRPARFVAVRGQRGAVVAGTLEALQERLAQPWSPDEFEEFTVDRAMLSHAEREVK